MNKLSKIRVRGVVVDLLVLGAALLQFWASPSQAETRAVILASPNGTPVYTLNPDAPMIPASTLKLLTSLAALEKLGPDYRFHTLVAYEKKTHRLYIKGFGDPLLISEELARMAGQVISVYNPDRISDIIMDNSFFSPGISIPGTGRSKNPYDATTGSLCANFNTFHFKWSSKTNTYESAEPQTPYLDIFTTDILASGLKRGRLLLAEPLRPKYPGLLLANFIARQHIPVTGKVRTGPFCPDCTSTITFESSFTLDQVVKKLMAFSNNFIANQIMLTLGTTAFDPPANLEKGVAILADFARTRLGLEGIKLVEGSGLSRQNRISARQMLCLLKAFTPYHQLLRQQETEFYKTGTLSDVRTRAGYFTGRDEKLYPYVIMLNDTSSSYEQILRGLKRRVASLSSQKS